jgi:aspartate-semialdehyde dehydrogenase
MKKYNVAVLGATGAVGQELLSLLCQRNFPAAEIKALASARSRGKKIEVAGREYTIEEATAESFRDVDIAFFCAGGAVSKKLAPVAVDAGAVVIDNTSAFRMDPDVPLVVPEVNGEAIFQHKGIIANPNCSTIVMLVPLWPIHKAAGIKRIVVSTYQAVSGAGKDGMDELVRQVKAYYLGEEVEPRVLPVSSLDKHYPIAFNLLPQIDVFAEEDYTKEEWKMVNETQKIMGSSIAVTATTVRVPVYRCHSESVNLELERPLSPQEARELLADAPGVRVMDNPEEMVYPMPYNLSGRDEVFVGRIRRDLTVPSGLNLWLVGDQIRKGAALNAVQIGEHLVKEG